MEGERNAHGWSVKSQRARAGLRHTSLKGESDVQRRFSVLKVLKYMYGRPSESKVRTTASSRSRDGPAHSKSLPFPDHTTETPGHQERVG